MYVDNSTPSWALGTPEYQTPIEFGVHCPFREKKSTLLLIRFYHTRAFHVLFFPLGTLSVRKKKGIKLTSKASCFLHIPCKTSTDLTPHRTVPAADLTSQHSACLLQGHRNHSDVAALVLASIWFVSIIYIYIFIYNQLSHWFYTTNW